MSDETYAIPAVHHRRRGRPSAVWIVPIIAIVAAGALAVRTYLHTGPTIHITFDTAEGIEGGKSEVRYKNVPVGKVTSVELTRDRQHIIATVKLTSGGASVATKDSQFWVERPRIGVGGVSGLGTLLSGAFIGVDLGSSTEDETSFVGLEKPPGVTSDQHGTRFRLNTSDAGSLAAQSPVYVHRQSVGTILSTDLASDGKTIDMEIFVAAPFDRFVTENTVFWNASGLDVTLDASGLRVNTQSLATVVAGGIEFGLRDGAPPTPPAHANRQFHLFPDRRHAMALPDAPGLALEMRFDRPIRGTAAGVNVEFEGIHIGEVVDIVPDYDETTHAFYFDAHATVFPERLGPAYTKLVAEGARSGLDASQTLQRLVDRGLRAQIKSSNLLTGSYYIDLDWFPRAKPTKLVARDGVWVVPTERGGGTEAIQGHVESILAKIDRIPFEDIAGDLANASRAASSVLGHLDTNVMPAVQGVLARADIAMSALREGLAALAAPDSPIQERTRSTLEQVERAAFSLRTLTDYLSHHPESLVRGRVSGSEPKGK
jgi:paraquat-inducible protein B